MPSITGTPDHERTIRATEAAIAQVKAQQAAAEAKIAQFGYFMTEDEQLESALRRSKSETDRDQAASSVEERPDSATEDRPLHIPQNATVTPERGRSFGLYEKAIRATGADIAQLEAQLAATKAEVTQFDSMTEDERFEFILRRSRSRSGSVEERPDSAMEARPLHVPQNATVTAERGEAVNFKDKAEYKQPPQSFEKEEESDEYELEEVEVDVTEKIHDWDCLGRVLRYEVGPMDRPDLRRMEASSPGHLVVLSRTDRACRMQQT